MSVITFDVAELHQLAPLPTGRGCDFCLGSAPAYRYPARDVGLVVVAYRESIVSRRSRGEWRACDDCSTLIDAGDWPALARRGLRSLNVDLSHARPGTRVRLLATLHAAHEQFRKARTGSREVIK